jgi:hypothetical protein
MCHQTQEDLNQLPALPYQWQKSTIKEGTPSNTETPTLDDLPCRNFLQKPLNHPV